MAAATRSRLVCGVTEASSLCRDDLVRTGRHDGAQRGGFAHREIGQIGTVAAERSQQRSHRGARREAALRTADVAEAFDQPVGCPAVVRARPDGWQAEWFVLHARESWA
jgi:hypothetical protein